MYSKIFICSGCFILIFSLFFLACASVDYMGKTYPPTTKIDIYYSKEDIKKEYEVMGKALCKGSFASSETMEKK